MQNTKKEKTDQQKDRLMDQDTDWQKRTADGPGYRSAKRTADGPKKEKRTSCMDFASAGCPVIQLIFRIRLFPDPREDC
jgi:hypothetical protein